VSRFTNRGGPSPSQRMGIRWRALPVEDPPPVISRDSLFVILASWFAIGTVLALLWSVG
jgi:hypothetical protein